MRWVVWFLALYVLYEIVAMVQDATEAITGVFVAAIALALTAAAFRLAKIDVRTRWAWLRYWADAPVRMVSDAVQIIVRIVASFGGRAHLEGYFMRLPFALPDERDAFDEGRAGMAIYGVCIAPNSIVADVDERGELLVHKLFAGEQPARSPEWPV